MDSWLIKLFFDNIGAEEDLDKFVRVKMVNWQAIFSKFSLRYYSIKPEFYDPKLDDKDELWAQKKRKATYLMLCSAIQLALLPFAQIAKAVSLQTRHE
ncbi:Hypothetical predicted protein [Olea europaea subsp. europaea]|uniref:Uncharacterized protein n=1 Tax=Olea europaea subsp. europaea TaxID=158383 RepID=A0A8S0UC65_OLEEU|nr:Hypothetical predicted protein [Olea europaea subsp. europaea]